MILYVLCAVCVLLVVVCCYLVLEQRKAERQVDRLFDAIARLATKNAELAQIEDDMEDRVIEKLSKKMDDGLQKMMAWNPFDTANESEGI